MAQTLAPAEVDSIKLTPSRVNHEVVARASALVPLIREHAEQSSVDRRVVPEVMQALEAQGLFKLFVPRRYGGYEENMRTLMETLAEVARGDGSTAWAVALLNMGTWFATTFSQRAQDDVFGANPEAKCCGVFTPGSKAEPVEGVIWSAGSGPFVGVVRCRLGNPGHRPRRR
jgi:alkylation response protein AidB-like acyl-CoA dehydrogenase